MLLETKEHDLTLYQQSRQIEYITVYTTVYSNCSETWKLKNAMHNNLL